MLAMKFVMQVVFFIVSCLNAGLLPDYDKHCDNLIKSKYDLQLPDNEGRVPKSIHQIWFGDPGKLPKQTLTWRQYQKDLYAYHLWTEQDTDFMKTFMKTRNHELLLRLLQRKQWWAASDILRYELLRNFGGIYVDCDFQAPTCNGELVALTRIFSLNGLTFVTEHHGRNIGSGNALFCMNGILAAPPNHPFYEHLCDKVSDNVEFWHTKKKNYDAMYCTGPFFLNRCLNCPARILPISFIEDLHMQPP